MRLLALASLALLAGAPAASRAQDPEVRAGDLWLRVPATWQRAEQDGTTAFAAPASGPGKATLLAIHAGPMKGSLRATFDAEWKSFLADFKAQRTFPVTSGKGPGGVELLATQAVLTDQAGTALVAQLMAFPGAGRFQALMLYSSDAPSAAFDQAMAAMPGILGSVRVAGKDAPGAPAAQAAQAAPQADPAPSAAPRPGGPLDGVYRSRMGNYTSADPRVHASVVYKYATFFPDGVINQAQPEYGLAGYDRAAEIRRNPTGWGRWELSGGRGRVVFPADPRFDKEPTVWNLSVGPGGEITLNKGNYDRLDPCDGLRLQGTYGRRDRNEYAPQTITFSPDGRFSDQGVMRAAAVLSRSFQSDDGRPGTGTYWIGQWTLKLTYDDGRVKQAFFALNEQASRADPRLIEINTYVFDRR